MADRIRTISIDGRLPDPREARILVKPLELAVMLFHIHQAAQDPEIGYLDADNNINRITNDLNRKPAAIRQSQVEAALAACNLAEEQGKFWDPLDRSIDGFIGDVIGASGKNYRFDKNYHLFFLKS